MKHHLVVELDKNDSINLESFTAHSLINHLFKVNAALFSTPDTYYSYSSYSSLAYTTEL